MERGYSGVGIDEIGGAVGISGPAVYRHVTGKEQLITEIAASWLESLAARTRAANDTAAAATPQARLEALLTAALETAHSHAAELTVVSRYTDIATEPFSSTDDAQREAYRTSWQAVVDLWTPALRATHPELHAEQAPDYIRLSIGLVLGAAASERDLSAGARVSLLADAVLRLLQVPLDLPPPVSTETEPHPPARWKRANRREQILDTAVRMFRERGYGGVSMADIADEVGVTPSASYRHFTSKEELLATAVERAGDRVALSLSSSLASATNGEEAVEALIRALVGDITTNRDSISVAVTERYHLSPEELSATRKRERLLVEEWTHALAVTRPELSLASRELLVLAVHRLVVEAVHSLPRHALPDAADTLLRVCRAVVAPKTSA